ncbi:MAG: hypothetical protein IID13_10365 [Candidatus Marinimicrobia bacterium]|nr:hypothetical protein [Candidatus Neomarinimicrobiota bacterium]
MGFLFDGANYDATVPAGALSVSINAAAPGFGAALAPRSSKDCLCPSASFYQLPT